VQTQAIAARCQKSLVDQLTFDALVALGFRVGVFA